MYIYIYYVYIYTRICVCACVYMYIRIYIVLGNKRHVSEVEKEYCEGQYTPEFLSGNQHVVQYMHYYD